MEVHTKKRTSRGHTILKGNQRKRVYETKLLFDVGPRKVHFADFHLFRCITSRKPDFSLRPHGTQKPILGHDVIFQEILPRLPLTSLFRFKLVCKEWYKVISADRVFRNSQSKRCQHHHPSLMYVGGSGNYFFLDESLKSLCVPEHIDLRASSNGLLCSAHEKSNGVQDFSVWNPFTKDVVYVPGVRKSALPHFMQNVSLAFEPSSDNPHFTLVCPDINTDPHGNGETFVYFTVYSSATGKWKASNAKICRVYHDTFWPKSEARSVYMGGKLYWKIWRDVLWLDIKEDSGGIIAVPFLNAADFPEGEIGDYNGELSYITMWPRDIVIWTLRSNEKSEFGWVRRYCLRLTEMFRNGVKEMESCCSDAFSQLIRKNDSLVKRPSYKTKSSICTYRRALPFVGGEVLFWVLHGKEEVIFCYNTATRVLRALHDTHMNRWGYVLSHKSSIAPVPSPCE